MKHLGFLIVLAGAVLFQTAYSATCFTSIYPRILGGLSGDTIFHSMDLEPTKKLDLVLGGQTSDVGITGTLYSAPDPILVYMVNGGLYKWGFSFTGVNLETVNTVKFNTLGTKLFTLITA